MKQLFLGGMTLAAVFAGPAMAADMPLKAPPPARVYDWSGAYFGFNAGSAWADVERFYPQSLAGPLSATTGADGGIYGIHAGLQKQWGNWVIGVEVAYGKGFDVIDGSVALPTPPFAADTSALHRINNLFTVGPRLGYAWDRWMIYATGGYANGDITAQYTFTSTGALRFPGFWGRSQNDGWYAGGGIEYMVLKGAFLDVIFGAEYQHFDLKERNSFCVTACNPANAEDYRVSASGDIVRARLTFKTQGFFWGR